MTSQEIDDRCNCNIKNTVQVICPKCGAMVSIPMHQAVNGEKIICSVCRFEFEFRLPE